MSDTSIDQIAENLRAAFAAGAWHEAVIPVLADVIEVEHHPTRGEHDGPTSRDALVAQMRDNDHHGALADASQTLRELSVEGDVIITEQTFAATIVASGQRMSIPLTDHFTFRDGLLVAIDHYTDPADTDALLKPTAD